MRARPKKLVVNLVLRGRGTVEIGALRLVEHAQGANACHRVFGMRELNDRCLGPSGEVFPAAEGRLLIDE